MGRTFKKRSNEEKRHEIEKITKELDEQVGKIFDSENYKKYLKTMSKFHNYSFNNTLLIALQRPDASLVAGFNAWKNNFHRNVKRGEKGIKILAPAPVKKEREVEMLDPVTNKRVLDEHGNPKMETVQVTIPLYKVAYVYDVAQTEGEDLPSLGVNELTNKVNGYNRLIKAIESVSPVPVSYEDIEGSAKGFYSLQDKKIVVKAGMSESQTLKTLIHETAYPNKKQIQTFWKKLSITYYSWQKGLDFIFYFFSVLRPQNELSLFPGDFHFLVTFSSDSSSNVAIALSSASVVTSR